MRRVLAVGALALVLIAFVAAGVPLSMMWLGIELSVHGYAAVFLTVFFSFVVGGGLMFLIFFSARHGYDDAAHHGDDGGDHPETR
ncbi:MAG: hypothetical protein ACRED5_14225 [Propylenella sp.]